MARNKAVGDEPAAAKVAVEFRGNVKHDGVWYAAGERAQVDAAGAAGLIALGMAVDATATVDRPESV